MSILFNCDPGALLWPSVPQWVHWHETAQPAQNTPWRPTSLFKARESQCPFYIHYYSGCVHWWRVHCRVDHCHKKVRAVMIGNFWRGLIVRQKMQLAIILFFFFFIIFYHQISFNITNFYFTPGVLKSWEFLLTLTGYKWKQIHLFPFQFICTLLFTLYKLLVRGPYIFFQLVVCECPRLRPSPENSPEIKKGMEMTYAPRRFWITGHSPTLEEIFEQYPRFIDLPYLVSTQCYVMFQMHILNLDHWFSTCGSEPQHIMKTADPHAHNALQRDALWACRFVGKGWETGNTNIPIIIDLSATFPVWFGVRQNVPGESRFAP